MKQIIGKVDANKEKAGRCKVQLDETRSVRAKALLHCSNINYCLETGLKMEDGAKFTKVDAKELFDTSRATSIRLNDLAKMLKPFSAPKTE